MPQLRPDAAKYIDKNKHIYTHIHTYNCHEEGTIIIPILQTRNWDMESLNMTYPDSNR